MLTAFGGYAFGARFARRDTSFLDVCASSSRQHASLSPACLDGRHRLRTASFLRCQNLVLTPLIEIRFADGLRPGGRTSSSAAAGGTRLVASANNAPRRHLQTNYDNARPRIRHCERNAQRGKRGIANPAQPTSPSPAKRHNCTNKRRRMVRIAKPKPIAKKAVSGEI